MPRVRTIIAFLGGAIVALLVGLIPGELIGWLRDWAGADQPGPDDQRAQAARTRLRKKRSRR